MYRDNHCRLYCCHVVRKFCCCAAPKLFRSWNHILRGPVIPSTRDKGIEWFVVWVEVYSLLGMCNTCSRHTFNEPIRGREPPISLYNFAYH
jgi:hypothetical protein